MLEQHGRQTQFGNSPQVQNRNTSKFVVGGAMLLLMGTMFWCAACSHVDESKAKLDALTERIAKQKAILAETQKEIYHLEGKDATSIRDVAIPEARKYLDDGKCSEALLSLAKLWYRDLKRPEVQILLDKAAKGTTQQRLDFARDYENERLAAGEDYRVAAIGSYNTTLHLRYALASRPLVYQMEHDTNFDLGLRKLGFRRVELVDSYSDRGWWYMPTGNQFSVQ
jgi:hypothetical protein